MLERARLAGADETESRPYLFHGVRIALDIGRGRLSEAEQRLDRVERPEERGGEPEWVALTSQLRAELATWQGDPRRARTVVAEGLERLAGMGELADVDDLGALYALGLRAEADLSAISRRAHAEAEIHAAQVAGRVYLERMRALDESTMRQHPAAAPMASADLALCEAEAARLARRPSASLWSAAAAAWDAQHMPYRQAYALYREAEALLGSGGSRKRAEVPLRTAHAVAMALGAVPLRHVIEALAGHARHERQGLFRRGGPVIADQQAHAPSSAHRRARPGRSPLSGTPGLLAGRARDHAAGGGCEGTALYAVYGRPGLAPLR